MDIWIGFFGVIIGASISAIVAWLVAKQTQKVEMKKQKIKFLSENFQELKRCYQFILNNSVNIVNIYELEYQNLNNIKRIVSMVESYIYLFKESETTKIVDQTATLREFFDDMRSNIDPSTESQRDYTYYEIFDYYDLVKELFENKLKNIRKSLEFEFE